MAEYNHAYFDMMDDGNIQQKFADAHPTMTAPELGAFGEDMNLVAKGTLGVVKFFKSKKGFGFVVPEKMKGVPDDLDAFVHFTTIKIDSAFKTLAAGEVVKFDLYKGKKGYLGINVCGWHGGCVLGDKATLNEVKKSRLQCFQKYRFPDPPEFERSEDATGNNNNSNNNNSSNNNGASGSSNIHAKHAMAAQQHHPHGMGHGITGVSLGHPMRASMRGVASPGVVSLGGGPMIGFGDVADISLSLQRHNLPSANTNNSNNNNSGINQHHHHSHHRHQHHSHSNNTGSNNNTSANSNSFRTSMTSAVGLGATNISSDGAKYIGNKVDNMMPVLGFASGHNSMRTAHEPSDRESSSGAGGRHGVGADADLRFRGTGIGDIFASRNTPNNANNSSGSRMGGTNYRPMNTDYYESSGNGGISRISSNNGNSSSSRDTGRFQVFKDNDGLLVAGVDTNYHGYNEDSLLLPNDTDALDDVEFQKMSALGGSSNFSVLDSAKTNNHGAADSFVESDLRPTVHPRYEHHHHQYPDTYSSTGSTHSFARIRQTELLDESAILPKNDHLAANGNTNLSTTSSMNILGHHHHQRHQHQHLLAGVRTSNDFGHSAQRSAGSNSYSVTSGQRNVGSGNLSTPTTGGSNFEGGHGNRDYGSSNSHTKSNSISISAASNIGGYMNSGEKGDYYDDENHFDQSGFAGLDMRDRFGIDLYSRVGIGGGTGKFDDKFQVIADSVATTMASDAPTSHTFNFSNTNGGINNDNNNYNSFPRSRQDNVSQRGIGNIGGNGPNTTVSSTGYGNILVGNTGRRIGESDGDENTLPVDRLDSSSSLFGRERMQHPSSSLMSSSFPSSVSSAFSSSTSSSVPSFGSSASSSSSAHSSASAIMMPYQAAIRPSSADISLGERGGTPLSSQAAGDSSRLIQGLPVSREFRVPSSNANAESNVANIWAYPGGFLHPKGRLG